MRHEKPNPLAMIPWQCGQHLQQSVSISQARILRGQNTCIAPRDCWSHLSDYSSADELDLTTISQAAKSKVPWTSHCLPASQEATPHFPSPIFSPTPFYKCHLALTLPANSTSSKCRRIPFTFCIDLWTQIFPMGICCLPGQITSTFKLLNSMRQVRPHTMWVARKVNTAKM